MSRELLRAEESLLDWALAEIEGAATPPDLTARIVERARTRADRRAGDLEQTDEPRAWTWAAAVIVAALSVVAAVALMTLSDRVDPAAPAQDPERAAPVRVADARDIAALPRDTRDVEGHNLRDRELALLAERCPDLERLDLGHGGEVVPVRITDEGLRSVARLLELRELSLRGCALIEGGGLAHLTALPLLHTLDLSGTALSNAAYAHLARLPSLRRLDLSRCAELRDEGLTHVASLPGLRWLSLSRSGGVSDTAIAKLAALTRLEHLDLGHVNGRSALEPPSRNLGVTDAALAELAKLTHLETLVLAGCRSYTGPGLRCTRSMPRLRWLDVSGNRSITAEALGDLPPSVTRLDLAGCAAIGNGAVSVLVESCPRLAELDLSRTSISDEGLAALLDATQLSSLELRSCAELTADAMKSLLRASSLVALDISGMAWVDDTHRAALRGLPVLKTLTAEPVEARGGVMRRR